MSKKLTQLLLFLFLIFNLPAFLFAQPSFKNGQQFDGAYALVHNDVYSATNSHTLGFEISTQPITICSGASIVIQGDVETPVPNSYSWEVLQGNTWVSAPGSNTAANYPSTLLVNNTNADILFSIRRKYITAGIINYDSFFDITVQPSAPILGNSINTPAISSYCSPGNPPTITASTPTGGTGAFTYQWQNSADNINFTDIAGATSITYDPPALTASTYYRRVVSSGNCAAPSVSNTIGIIIVPAISNNVVTAPAVTTFCSASDPSIITGNVPSGGDGTLIYQWQSSADNVTFTNITGATAKDYDPGVISTTTYYRRSVTSGVCNVPLNSNVITITVLPVITNNVINTPAVNNYCSPGNPPTITASTPTGGTGTFTYQWQSSADNVSFTNITGATSITYDPPSLAASTYYRRVVSSGSCVTPSVSASIAITITQPVTNNVVTAPAVTTFCSASDPSVITGNVPSGGDGTLTYQWQSSADNVTFTSITGATAKDYDPGVISATTYYRRSVTSGVCNVPLFSNVITITVLPVITNNTIITPAISSFCSSGDAAIITASTPTGGTGTFTYQWQSSADNINFTNIAGATSITYDPPSLAASTYYRRVVSSGSCVTPSVSASVAINITQPVTNNVVTAPAVTTFCSASDPSIITGNVPSGGDGTLIYQWQSSADDVTFTNITGATAKDYDPGVISATTYYRRSVTSGVCNVPVFSNVITITVLPVITSNVIIAPAITTFCSSGNAAAISGNTPIGGAGTYTYQWESSTDNVTFTNIAGATLKDFDPPVLSASTYYRRSVLSGSCITPVISNVVTINILPLPVVPVPAQTSVTVCTGNQAVLSVSSPQAGLTYNWYDSAAKTTLLFTGATYTTPAQTTSKTFYVESSNSSCTSASMATVLVNVVNIPNTPTVVSGTVSTCGGAPVLLSVSGAQAGITYSWYSSASGGSSVFSGVNFTTPPLSANTVYYVEATNAGGCTSASRAPVNVNVTVIPNLTIQGSQVCPGSAATLSATADVANATINWYTGATGGSPISTGNTFTTPPLNANTSYYAEAVNNTSGCISASRYLVQATLLQQLAAPVVTVKAATANSVTFAWDPVADAIGYKVSIDNGVTYTDPSSGSSGLTHTVSGLAENQSVSIMVKAVGTSSCQLSGSSFAVTAKAESQTDDIFVANAFTPNGDGNNDIVYVHSEGIKTLNFNIYSQWGEMLFNTANITSGWDGTYKGVKEPAGVYIYYLKAVMNNGHSVNKKGTITLLR